MGGGTPDHAAKAARVIVALGSQLRGKRCNVYSSDVRVRVVATGLDTYPDVSVVCGMEGRDNEDHNALINPIVLVEVLSPSTEAYDRGDKLEHHKRIPTLREIVLVGLEGHRLEVWRCDDATCIRDESDTAVELASIGCTLSCDEEFQDPLRDSDDTV